MSGLSLATGRPEYTDAGHLITVVRAGSQGRLWRMERHSYGSRAEMQRGEEYEPADEQATPDGGGRFLRYHMPDDDGVYAIECDGPDALVYWEVEAGEVLRIFDERQARREVLRR
jgi:hypothetical protein